MTWRLSAEAFWSKIRAMGAKGRRFASAISRMNLAGPNWLRMDLAELLPMAREWLSRQSLNRLGESGTLGGVKAWSGWARVSALLSVFALVLSVGYGVLASGVQHQLKETQAEIAALREQYIQSAAREAALPAYRKRVSLMQAQFSTMVDLIPASLEITQILGQISQASQAAGLRMLWFKPGIETPGDGFGVIPVDLRLSGSYHDIGRFLAAVSNMQHLLTVDLKIEPDAGSMAGQLLLTATVKAYRGNPVRDTEPRKVGLDDGR